MEVVLGPPELSLRYPTKKVILQKHEKKDKERHGIQFIDASFSARFLCFSLLFCNNALKSVFFYILLL